MVALEIEVQPADNTHLLAKIQIPGSMQQSQDELQLDQFDALIPHSFWIPHISNMFGEVFGARMWNPFCLSSVLSGEADPKLRTQRAWFHQRLLRNMLSVFLTLYERDAKSYGCDIFHSRTRVIYFHVSTGLAYTFAGPLESQRKTVFSRITQYRLAPFSTLPTHSTTRTSTKFRACSIPLRNWYWSILKKIWIWIRLTVHLPHGRDQYCVTIKWFSGQKQKYVSTQIPFFAWERWIKAKKPLKDGKVKWRTSRCICLTKNN